MKIALLSLFLVLPGVARADETAAFLKIGVGARALGMGGAYSAIANDINAMGWNPAGLSRMTRSELGFSHAQLAADTRYDFMGYAAPTAYGVLGAAGTYLNQGAIEGRDENGKTGGGYSASDSVMSLSYATIFNGPLNAGGNFKLIQSRIANASAQSYAFDFGGQYTLPLKGPGTPLLGLAVLNLGPGMRFMDQTAHLPLTLVGGVGYRLPVGLTLVADFKHRPYEDSNEISVGTEYALFSNFALRTGYASVKAQTGVASGSMGLINGFAAGFGIKVMSYSLDYSMTPAGELGNVQRLSLGMKFGREPVKASSTPTPMPDMIFLK